MPKPDQTCPCGSAQSFFGTPCCAEIISGTRKAKSPTELLRARYTAFATSQIEFITQTTHPRVREDSNETANRKWAETATFTKLEILNTESRGENAADVSFEAHYTANDQRQIHRERARFERLKRRMVFRLRRNAQTTNNQTRKTIARPKPAMPVRLRQKIQKMLRRTHSPLKQSGFRTDRILLNF
jgi:SEC-C motif-containing protein